MPRKRKYVRKTGPEAIKMISRIRGRNNRLWMDILALAVKSKPDQAKKIIAGIAENDRLVTRWLERV